MKQLGALELSCSFCHKPQHKVARLIASGKNHPRVYICDECVSVCNSILDRNAGESTRQDSTKETKGWVDRVKSWWKCGMIEHAF